MSFSAELQECIDLFIKEGFPKSKSKQKALLEAVLLHMGITEMEDGASVGDGVGAAAVGAQTDELNVIRPLATSPRAVTLLFQETPHIVKKFVGQS